jgi:GTP-dependent phosphoenolpyruvate carboxykinase
MYNLLKNIKKKFFTQTRSLTSVSPSQISHELHKYTKNHKLVDFVIEKALLCKPDNIHFCDGTEEEYQKLCEEMVNKKVLYPLKKKPNSFLAFSDPKDVARYFLK